MTEDQAAAEVRVTVPAEAQAVQEEVPLVAETLLRETEAVLQAAEAILQEIMKEVQEAAGAALPEIMKEVTRAVLRKSMKEERLTALRRRAEIKRER